MAVGERRKAEIRHAYSQHTTIHHSAATTLNGCSPAGRGIHFRSNPTPAKGVAG